jgi:hypothetical protein
MTVNRAKLGKTNKRLGSNAERLYAKVFRDLGFNFCKTARQGSKLHDDAGIDLMHLPFNVQIKAGDQKGMNPATVLRIIKERIPNIFPATDPVHDNPNILIHKKKVGQGKKKDEFDELVTMSFKDFTRIMNKTWL